MSLKEQDFQGIEREQQVDEVNSRLVYDETRKEGDLPNKRVTDIQNKMRIFARRAAKVEN